MSRFWFICFRVQYRILAVIDPLVRWIWRRFGIGNVIDFEVARRDGQGTRSRLLGLLRVGDGWYLGHPNGPVGWTRDLVAAGEGTIHWPGNGGTTRVGASLLPRGEERGAAILATGQHPFPGNLVYRRWAPPRARGRRLLQARAVKLLQRVVGPITTNLYVLADERSREAIAIDTATPCREWLTGTLAERGWTLKLIVSTHRHWDHIGDNAAVAQATGAQIAAHVLDRHGLERPEPLFAPFPIPPSVPAIELQERSRIRFGEIELEVLHTPGHTEGSVCLRADSERLLLTGDTLFAQGWGRTDLPGGDEAQMVDSLARLSTLAADLRVLPGHGPQTTIEREQPWLADVARQRRLPF